jgi:GTP cyclohydrolase I
MLDETDIQAIQTIFKKLNLDINDPNLIDTPKRILKMWRHDFCNTVGKEFTDFKSFPNTDVFGGYNQMITSEEIEFSSVCSHHFLPFSGKAWFGYIPDELIIGKSKPGRLIKHYCMRPQLQENLVHAIMNTFVQNIKPKGAMLIMKAVHGCEYCRGSKTYSPMTTSAIYGVFDQEKVRNEFLSLIQLPIR